MHRQALRPFRGGGGGQTYRLERPQIAHFIEHVFGNLPPIQPTSSLNPMYTTTAISSVSTVTPMCATSDCFFLSSLPQVRGEKLSQQPSGQPPQP